MLPWASHHGEEQPIASPPTQPPTLALSLDAPPPGADWPGPLAALPRLGAWLERAALGAWAPDQRRAEPGAAGLIDRFRDHPNVALGLVNLPGCWPPPPGAGWRLPRPPARHNQAYLTHPPEMAADVADLAAGLTWFARRRPVRAHQRDQRLAEAGACAWLVREHALRLAAERPVAWLGVGFMGLDEAWNLTMPAAANLFGMLLGQIDDHAAALARVQRPEVVAILAGAGWAIWAPGRVRPGRVDGLEPAAVASRLAAIGGLAAHDQPRPCPPPAPGRRLAGGEV